MKGGKSYLFWAGLPLLLLLFGIGFLSVINWGYEGKLFSLDNSTPNWTGVHIGPLLLMVAIGLALIAGLLLSLVWIFWPKSHVNWFFVPLMLITILLIFPSLFVVVLAPAAITMAEQLRSGSK